jgi:putative tricarboxylic transport membrane protein
LTIRALPITALCFLALGIAYLIGSLDLRLGSATSPGPGLYPFFVGLTLLAITVPLFLLSLKTKEPRQGEEEAFPRGKDLKRVVALASMFIFFAVLLKPLGYWICSTVLMGASLKLLGMRSGKKIIVISVLTTAISYLLFVSILKVPIPLGIFFS